MLKVERIDHVALTVRDVQRSVDWYRRMFGLERRYEDAWRDYPAVVCAGETCIAFFPAATDSPVPPPDENTIAMRHLAVSVDAANFAQARTRLKEEGIPFTFSDHGISHSLYIRDPDGHQIEITTYDL